jgi:hypothetical protein
MGLAALPPYRRRVMLQREIDRRRERDRAPVLPLRREDHPVLALQRAIGNRAVAQILARAPAMTGSVQIHGVGEVKVTGGNLGEWAGTGVPDTVDLTSHTGRHSAKLEKLAGARTRTDVKVTISAANDGDTLGVGAGTLLEIKDARVEDYAVADGVETWRLVDFTNVHRTKITHRVS